MLERLAFKLKTESMRIIPAAHSLCIIEKDLMALFREQFAEYAEWERIVFAFASVCETAALKTLTLLAVTIF